MSIKLMLKRNLKTLGKIGDIVSVSEGYARNYLLPRGIAVEQSASALQFIEAEKKRALTYESQRLGGMKEMAQRISALDITLAENVHDGDDLYGAVQAKSVVDALAEEGFAVDPDCVIFLEPIKKLGVHQVKIQFHAEAVATLKVWVVEKKDIDAAE